MSILRDMAIEHGTDKALHYADFYHDLLHARRDEFLKVLEFGIGHPGVMLESVARLGMKSYEPGASLKMWREYFPNAEIFALDNNVQALEHIRREPRIFPFYCDQSDPESYPDAIGKNFDLIIDDGSHRPEDQILCAQMLTPLLNGKGIYIVEDAAPYDDVFLAAIANAVGEPFKFQSFDFNSDPLDPARLVVIRK